MEARLADASTQLREARLLSPRTANFQQRFEVGATETRLAAYISLYLPISPCISLYLPPQVGVNETLLGAFPCARLHGAGVGAALRHGVLYVSTGHLCFETTLCAAANTKLPLSRVASLERSRDPVFHLIPNALKLHLEQGGALLFAAFQHRDEAHALLARCLPSAAARQDIRQDSAGRATS